MARIGRDAAGDSHTAWRALPMQPDGHRKVARAPAFHSQNEGCQESTHFEAGPDAPSTFGQVPKARDAAHPQERQHSAAEGGTSDRVSPAGVLRRRHAAPLPDWAETLVLVIDNTQGGAVIPQSRDRRHGRQWSSPWFLFETVCDTCQAHICDENPARVWRANGPPINLVVRRRI
jgi:hypothetical protein